MLRRSDYLIVTRNAYFKIKSISNFRCVKKERMICSIVILELRKKKIGLNSITFLSFIMWEALIYLLIGSEENS